MLEPAHDHDHAPKLGGPRAVVARYRDLALAPTEVLVAVGLDAAGRVVCERRLPGGADRVRARPRDLLQPVLAVGAVALLAVHNHPSGTPEPSASDLAFTVRLALAARLCGVVLVDHVIVASRGWCSLRAVGGLGPARYAALPCVSPGEVA